MTLEFLPAAEQEFAEATVHYEEAEMGFGVRFREECRARHRLLFCILYFGGSDTAATGA